MQQTNPIGDESTQVLEGLPASQDSLPGELVEWMRRDTWTRGDAMLILMGIDPDRTAITERQTEYRRPEWVFEADGPWMMGGCDQTPTRVETRRLAERLTAMMRTWDSDNHPALCLPNYYIKWADAHGFEVPWLESAHSTGLIDAVALGVVSTAGQGVLDDGGSKTTEARQEQKQDLGAALPPPAIEETPTATITPHRIGTRGNILKAVIKKAETTATDADDPESVWAELVKMAENNPPAPLIGYSSDGIQYRGAKHQDSGEPDVFTKKNLRERMRRAKAR